MNILHTLKIVQLKFNEIQETITLYTAQSAQKGVPTKSRHGQDNEISLSNLKTLQSESKHHPMSCK